MQHQKRGGRLYSFFEKDKTWKSDVQREGRIMEGEQRSSFGQIFFLFQKKVKIINNFYSFQSFAFKKMFLWLQSFFQGGGVEVYALFFLQCWRKSIFGWASMQQAEKLIDLKIPILLQLRCVNIFCMISYVHLGFPFFIF